MPPVISPHTFLIISSAHVSVFHTFLIVNNLTLIGDLLINMKLGLNGTFVLDVPHRSVWSVYYTCLEVPRRID